MKTLVLRDNHPIKGDLAETPIIRELTNRDFTDLDKQRFIIFPRKLSESVDLGKDNLIFEKRNGVTWTCNIAGFLSSRDTEVVIQSRFTNPESQQDFFLQYMLQKVLNYNVVDSWARSDNSNLGHELLIFLFPYYLNEALRKGLYKEYVKRKHNDIHVKGKIDLPMQITKNIPFVGKVAYQTREFSYDNKLTQLIRHTIEVLQIDHANLLSDNEEIRENVRSLKLTTNTYSRFDRERIIQENRLNSVKHGFFEEYFALQQLCLRILTNEQVGFGEDDEQVHGLIIDIAWLWEEYIGKITVWQRYGRRKDLDSGYLFSDNPYVHRYPDFVYTNCPIDTKYKRKLNTVSDYNQITTYIHMLSAKRGGFLQPTNSVDPKIQGYHHIGFLHGLGGEVFQYKFYVPQNAETYEQFVEEIQVSEEKLLKYIETDLTG